MPKSTNNVQNLSNQDLFILKRKSKTVSKIVITIGQQKFHMDNVEAYVLNGDDGVAFLSIPSLYGVFKGKDLINEEDKAAALKSLRTSKTSESRAKGKNDLEIPAELAAMLESFSKANNSRVIFDPAGGYKIQKVRKPKK